MQLKDALDQSKANEVLTRLDGGEVVNNTCGAIRPLWFSDCCVLASSPSDFYVVRVAPNWYKGKEGRKVTIIQPLSVKDVTEVIGKDDWQPL